MDLRHNLDVMHIEKNICDSIIGTLLNIEGKTKDTLKSRIDLTHLGIRKDLLVQDEGKPRDMALAVYVLVYLHLPPANPFLYPGVSNKSYI